MQQLTYREALRQAMTEEMHRDPKVFMFGQDIGVEGGMWEVTRGMMDVFGSERIKDTPISESAILGAGLGAAMAGQRPIVEIMYNDFIPAGMDQLVNQIAKVRYMFGGQVKVPIVVRTSIGYGFGLAAAHAQSLEAWFSHIPGLLVAMPGSPASAKGLLKAAIRNDNPVVFMEHALLYNDKGEVPESPDFLIPLGKAEVVRQGKDITIVCWSLMVKRSMGAAKLLETDGISAEVIDLHTTSPLDISTVLDSVKKTRRLLIAQQACGFLGVGAEVVAQVVESGLALAAPPKRVAGKNIPIPFAESLEKLAVPNVEDIVHGALSIVQS